MKAIKNTQIKLKELTSITILDSTYKLSKLRYPLNDKDWFEFIGIRFEYNKKFITLGLLKTITGVIQNESFTYESLNKDLKLYNYLTVQNNIFLINEISLKINKKKWFDINEKKSPEISGDFSINSSDLINEENGLFIPDKLLKTCIIKPYTNYENYNLIPIFHFHGSNSYVTQNICILEIVVDILSKRFPSVSIQLHQIVSQDLNKAELTNTTLEDISNLSKEELLELYKKEHEKVQKYESKNKSNSLEETEKLYDKYMNESELFRNEIKRINCELFKEFIDNYIEGNKINTSQIIKEQFRSTSSIDLGNIGENYVKNILNELQIKYEDTSGTAHQSDIYIKDKTNKIIFILEVKNKKEINNNDITKFNRDIENIIKLNPDYTIVPLFISLSNSNINESKGKFNITDNITYITLPYVTKETLQMFFELNRNFIQYLHSNEELNKSIKSNQNLINMFLSLTKSSKNIDLLLNNLKKENLSIQQIIFNNLPSNLTVKELQRLKIKIQLILYIRTTPKWTLKGCYEIDKERVIIKSKIRKEDVKTILGI